MLVGIILVKVSVDTMYLTSTSNKHHAAQLVTLFKHLQLCADHDNHMSMREEWSDRFTCTVNQLSHCLWRPGVRAQLTRPNSTVYCGIISSLRDGWTLSPKRIITIKVARNFIINFNFLIFKFQWLNFICAAHGITVVELSGRSRNVYCGNRSPWTFVTKAHQAIVEIATLPNMKFAFSISYFHCKLQWFGAIYLIHIGVKKISDIHGEFIDLSDLITGYDYYLLVDPWQRMRIALLYDINSTVNASFIYYDGPGDKSDIAYKTINRKLYGIRPVLTTSYRAMIRTNLPIKVTIKIALFDNAHIPCDVKGAYHIISLTSAVSRNIACMYSVDFIKMFNTKGLHKLDMYPLLHIKDFIFHGPSVMAGESEHNCQYGGLFIWHHINKKSTYICEKLQNYYVYSDVSFLVIFLVWYPEYSQYLLNAQLRKDKCITRYTAPNRLSPFTVTVENTLIISDSLPCEMIICTPLQFRIKRKYCTINISSQGSIGPAHIIVRPSNVLHTCSYFETDTRNFFIYAEMTENWPFGKPRDVSIIKSSLEEYYKFYSHLNRIQISLPYICPKHGSLKQMSVKVQIAMCKATPEGLIRTVLFDIHPLSSECGNVIRRVTFYFKTDPHFFTTSKRLTVIQKEGNKKYDGVYIKVVYEDCPEECKIFTYTLTILQKWRGRIYQYTKPVGTETFTGHFYQGLKLTITRPRDMCGKYSHCEISYFSTKSVQNAEMTSNASVTELYGRLLYFQSKR